uniref:CSON010387 protein n=1 Tax=Culicoides sonorensis TaxID=179676 RepID=A0A336LYF2_CULSO
MISAVESHMGPGRPSFYASPHLPHSPMHLQSPISQTSVQIPPSSTQTGLPNYNSSSTMSDQFARPHPKTRFNGVLPRNGVSSPRSKYPDQNGPVNLAVMPNNASSPHSPNIPSPNNNSASPKDDRPLAMDQSVSPKDTNLLETFSNSRLPYANNAAALVNAAYYRQFHYRFSGLYPHAHHSVAQSMQRFEPYPPFLPSVPYSPQPPSHTSASQQQQQQQQQQQGLGPLSISQQNGHSKLHIDRQPLPSLLPPLNANNPLIAQQQHQQQHKEMYKESSKISHQNNNINFNNHKDMKSVSPNSPHHNNNNNNNNNNLGFKVPSGKEGSLKHRILTRPYDKDGKPQRSPPGITNGMPLNRSNNVTTNINNNNVTNNNTHQGFMKGSLIELANGEFKRVEDMRTEDFILSSEKSSKLELHDSTVVKISPSNNQTMVITFSFNNNRSKVDIDASFEHPFFVYGKGWASCNPEGTYHLYSLKCQLLQVGDICISLKPREQSPRESNNECKFTPYDLPFNNNNNTNNNNNNNNNCDLPQNLSRRPQTIPTTATSTIPSTRPAPSVDMNSHRSHPSPMMSSLAYPSHPLEMHRPKFGIPQIIEPPSMSSSTNGHHPHHHQQQQQRPLSHETGSSLQERYANLIAANFGPHNPDMPIPMVLPHRTVNQLMAEDAMDSSTAKKRRWSAPDNFNDDELEEQHNALLRGKYSN